MSEQQNEPVTLVGMPFPSPEAGDEMAANPTVFKPDLGIVMAPKIVPANRGLIVHGARAGSLADYGTHREATLTIFTEDHPHGLMATVATYQTAAEIVMLMATTSDYRALIAAGFIDIAPVVGNSGEKYRVLIGRIYLTDVERIAMPTDLDWMLLTRCVASPQREPRVMTFPYGFERTMRDLITDLFSITKRGNLLSDNKQALRGVGERLDSVGGITAMRAAFEAARNFKHGAIKSELECAWDGIGEWPWRSASVSR